MRSLVHKKAGAMKRSGVNLKILARKFYEINQHFIWIPKSFQSYEKD